MAEAPIETVVDVAIVGGGPAGLSAALALRHRTIGRVVVLEREATAGGVPRHCAHSPFGMREFGRVMSGPAYARRLAAAAAAAGVEVRTGVSVLRLAPGGRMTLTGPDGLAELAARRVILATGARETPRSARLVGGDRPLGVLTTGTLQQAVHLERLKPCERPVIVGTELVSLSALITCRQAGMVPAAVIEPAARPSVPWALALFPRLLGVPVHYGAAIEEIVGERRVRAVILRQADGSRVSIACDGVVFTGRFVPEAALVRGSHLALDPESGGPAIDAEGRCSDPAYYAAGNGVRPVRTGGWCYRDGRRVGEAVAADLARR